MKPSRSLNSHSVNHLSIQDINQKFFSDKKDEVNIMTDLGNCAQRLIYVLIIGRLMQIADSSYDPNHIEEAKSNDGTLAQTILDYKDPLNYAYFRDMYSMMFDSLMISLRNLFYCAPGSCTAGSFIMTLANERDLQKLNELHRGKFSLPGYEIGFISKKDMRAEEIILKSGRKIRIPKTSGENNFIIYDDKKKYVAFYDIYSSKAQELAKDFFRKNYFDEDGKRQQNIQDIKEYEKFYFHKDHWPNGKRWNIKTEVKKIQGIPINYNYYENLCKTNIDKLIEKLENLVEIISLYYHSCYALGLNANMNIYCNPYGSLSKMVMDTCDCFATDKPDDFQEQTVRFIKNKIPNTIGAMMLSK